MMLKNGISFVIWLKFLSAFFLSVCLSQAEAHDPEYEFTIYIVPPPHPFNFNSPRSMMLTSFQGLLNLHHGFGKHKMGHAFIELKGPDYYRLTGASKQNLFFSGLKEFLSGYGFGMLFLGFPGKLDSESDLRDRTMQRAKHKKMAFIRFGLNEAAFTRMISYLREYEARGYQHIYNGENQPRNGKGAGCTAFALSFLEIVGITMPGPIKEWSYSVKVPDNLIGSPPNKHASVFDALITHRWASDTEPGRWFTITDPQRMYDWVVGAMKGYLNIQQTFGPDALINNVEPQMIISGKAPGLYFDCRNLPVDDKPMFY